MSSRHHGSLVVYALADSFAAFHLSHQTFEGPGERLTAQNWIVHLHRIHRAAVRLDALAGSAQVGSVHSWKFCATKFQLTPERFIPHIGLVTLTHVRLLKAFSTTLGLYHNLHGLHLEALVIDAPFRQIFSKLSRLDTLALRSCEIVARDGFIMRLRSFVISAQEPTTPTAKVSREPREPLRIVTPDSLHTLHLDAPSETVSLLTAFGRAQFLRLVALSLQHLSDLDMLLAFLAQCPGLETLKITAVHPDVIASLPQYTLSPDTIPALRDLTIVHGEMLAFFASNRPIAAAAILNEPLADGWDSTGPDFTPTALNDLLKASVPLLSLSIPETSPTPELLNSITTLFPQLKQFSICLKEPRWWGKPNSLRAQGVAHDKRCPVLRDADAFNDISEDTLSDAEEDMPSSITLVRVPNELKMSSYSLTNQHVHLAALSNDLWY
ncbi:hypothetical protein C8R45DRAFT_1152149 [Mycena sanguinolenta]|nr:hypothetical protein C8R45DRAFT_1152149 [Mycena sanguinolenta]